MKSFWNRAVDGQVDTSRAQLQALLNNGSSRMGYAGPGWRYGGYGEQRKGGNAGSTRDVSTLKSYARNVEVKNICASLDRMAVDNGQSGPKVNLPDPSSTSWKVSTKCEEKLLAQRALRDSYEKMEAEAQAEHDRAMNAAAQRLGEIKLRGKREKETRRRIRNELEKEREAARQRQSGNSVAAERLAVRKRPLSKEEEDLVEDILYRRPANEVLISAFKVDVTVKDLQCTRNDPHPVWMRDEVINFTMNLLAERERRWCNEHGGGCKPRVWFTSSFFMTSLLREGYCYKYVRRWTKRAKVDVFAPDFRMVVMPVNINNTHWVLCIVDFVKKEVIFIDSMAGSGTVHREALLRWVRDEHQNKKGAPLDPSVKWTSRATGSSLPQQMNGSDCGVFATMCAIYLSDPFGVAGDGFGGLGIPADFSQGDIPYFRKRILLDVLECCVP